MVIDPFTRQQLEAYIDAEVEKLQRSISRMTPSESDHKDSSITWWSRGQIRALEGLKTKINSKDE